MNKRPTTPKVTRWSYFLTRLELRCLQVLPWHYEERMRKIEKKLGMWS